MNKGLKLTSKSKAVRVVIYKVRKKDLMNKGLKLKPVFCLHGRGYVRKKDLMNKGLRLRSLGSPKTPRSL